MLDDQQFQLQADKSLQELHRALLRAADEHGFDADLGPALTIEFEDPPAKFVVSPNAPVRQVWVSAHHKSYKLSWDETRREFVLPENGESLREMIAGAVSRQLGESIEL